MGTESGLPEESIKKEGIVLLKEILNQPNSAWITDLDDTIKEPERVLWQDGKERKFYPEVATALLAIKKSGVKIGIVTEQSFSEVEPFISELSELILGSKNPHDLFNGLILAEGGSVVHSKEKGVVILAPKRAVEDKEKIVNWLWKNVIPSDIEGWFVLRGTNPEEATYVQLPPKEDICIATASLWEKGPHISKDPEYIQKYAKIQEAIERALKDLNISSLTTYEAGNGTLRIVPKFVNKGHSLELLSAFGILDLSSAVYSCDGPNDLKLAQKIKSKGGGVIAVANAIPKLHEISDFSTTLPSGKGFAEAASLIFPDEYTKAQGELQNLKLA